MTLSSTSIISDDIIVITFNVTIVDDTIITVITTGAPVRPPIIVFYLPCLKSSFQGRNKLSRLAVVRDARFLCLATDIMLP